MKYLKFLFQTRGLANTFYRAIKIFQRFGITPKKSENNLIKLSEIAQEFHVQPSLPTTAILLKRYPAIFKELQEKKVELAIHGLYHRVFSRMPFEEQYDQIKEAISIFDKNEISYKGFRTPYLSWNTDTLNAVKKNNFIWDSNKTILWDVLDERDYPPRKWEAYQKVLHYLYRPLHSSEYFSLPRNEDGLIEIPVSIPEDEIITDRLGITDKIIIEKIWRTILEKSYQRGELFTLMIHPERIPIFLSILKNILNEATRKNPSIWIASLNEIADWWKEKLRLKWNIEEIKKGEFKVNMEIPERGQILLKNISSINCKSELFNSYLRVQKSDFVVNSKLRPVIGLAKNHSANLEKFLLEEGWLYEISEKNDDYAFYLEGYTNFDSRQEMHLSSQIDSSDAPLIRLWRWPNNAKSALSITGDIDCLSLKDFFMRMLDR